MKTNTIHSLDDLLRSSYFNSFQADKLGNDLFINDPDRAERINEAAESGADGSTHAEAIEDMREANTHAERDIYRKQFEAIGFSKDCAVELAIALRDYIAQEIDDCEQWHEKNGSLNNQIG